MRVPKTQRRYCKKCNKHTEHKVTLYKKGKESRMAQGKRRYDRKKKGYGSQPKEIFRKNAKINKKSTPVYQCQECNRKWYGKAHRVKRFELIET